MVKYATIIKVVEEDLSKSHQHLRLNPKVIPDFNRFHEETCGKKIRKTEKGIFCDNEGNRIYFTRNGRRVDGINGTSKRVSIDMGELYLYYREHGEMHLTHNHPRESGFPSDCLSVNDIKTLLSSYDMGGLWDETPTLGYPIKSMSCESPNGQRMTLVRGDKFKHENYDRAIEIGGELKGAWDQYIKKYRDSKWEHFQIIEQNGKPEGIPEGGIHDFIVKNALKDVGFFEKSPEFKKIQKQFREIDCKLMVSYPSEYRVDY